MRRVAARAAALVLLLAPCLAALPAAAEPLADLVIEHARVVSPPLALREDASVVVRGGRIAEVAAGGAPAPARRRIDARGRTLLPGLIDTHVHLQLAAFADEAAYARWAESEGRALLFEYARHGFTTL